MAAALVVVIGQNSIPESFGRLTGYLTRLARVLCFMRLLQALCRNQGIPLALLLRLLALPDAAA